MRCARLGVQRRGAFAAASRRRAFAAASSRGAIVAARRVRWRGQCLATRCGLEPPTAAQSRSDGCVRPLRSLRVLVLRSDGSNLRRVALPAAAPAHEAASRPPGARSGKVRRRDRSVRRAAPKSRRGSRRALYTPRVGARQRFDAPHQEWLRYASAGARASSFGLESESSTRRTVENRRGLGDARGRGSSEGADPVDAPSKVRRRRGPRREKRESFEKRETGRG